jgi:glucosamine-6-phosphate deaminase
METHVYPDKRATSEAAADRAASVLKWAIDRKGRANFVVATGASQFDFLDALTAREDIDWSKTAMFHLDEYIGLPADHRASFRRYLRERFTAEVDPGAVHWIEGDADDPRAECDRLNDVLRGRGIDAAFIGIGENGHVAFNDPPADFETRDPFIVVELDEDCRNQQVGEGWFDSVDDVPERAITMSVHRIMAAESVVCTIPGERKAPAVRECFGDETIAPTKPASVLKEHPRAHVYLDEESASELDAD